MDIKELNGNAAARPINVNPQQAAGMALQFLERASHTRAERESYDVAQALLTAIVTGQVVLVPAMAAAPAVPPETPAPPVN